MICGPQSFQVRIKDSGLCVCLNQNCFLYL
uniref:Uncharacterized protein n=1 Tax=Arundo donax TaxID=35708 RepID=A0A0A9HC13_ARUDO